MNFALRRERVRDRLGELADDFSADGLIVTSLPNIRYLTGFSGSNAVLFISAADPSDDVIATDGRYQDQVMRECPDLPVLIDRATLGYACEQLSGHGVQHVRVERHISTGDLEQVREQVRQVVPSEAIVEELRIVKDDDELELLARACAITAQAMMDIAEQIGAGWTEIAVARRLEQRFGELGAEDRSFATIVASGANAGLPHHRPTHKELMPGDLVVIDAGALVSGYHADMTRTFVVGRPADWQREIHAAVDDAARLARVAAVPGLDLRDLDRVARGQIESAGHGVNFTHGLGHGVGLEIHEAPMIGPRALGRLCASTPITIEPGIYLAGQGGVRIEDTLVVGPGAVLTEADRGLLSVGTSATV